MHTAVDCYQMSMLYVMSKAWKCQRLTKLPMYSMLWKVFTHPYAVKRRMLDEPCTMYAVVGH